MTTADHNWYRLRILLLLRSRGASVGVSGGLYCEQALVNRYSEGTKTA